MVRLRRLGQYSPLPWTTRIALGLCFSVLIALFAWRRGSLSSSGAAAAIAIGTSIYLGGGGAWFICLVTFFVTSTLLGKVGRARKAQVKREFEKGDTRDAVQAFSNGGVAALCALGMFVFPHALWSAAFLGALATANADTWATELGVLSRSEPFSLLSFKRVPRGTSGAVSPRGLLATLLGGLAIGLIPWFSPEGFDLTNELGLGLAISAGVLGSMVDSLLGATLQASYYCPLCKREVEAPRHACGTRTEHARGVRWLNNDMVNLAATTAGACLSVLVARWVL